MHPPPSCSAGRWHEHLGAGVRQPTLAPPPLWLAPLLRAVRPLLPRDLCGRIEVECFRGGVKTITLRQTFKVVDEEV
jgi:hypothetical protein